MGDRPKLTWLLVGCLLVGSLLADGCGRSRVVVEPEPAFLDPFEAWAAGFAASTDAGSLPDGIEALAAARRYDYVWLPWWQAPPQPMEEVKGVLWVAVEFKAVEPLGGFAGVSGSRVDSRVALRDQDGRFELDFECVFNVVQSGGSGADPSPVAAFCDFESARLATELGLPPPAAEGLLADPFTLTLVPEEPFASLGSRRDGSNCQFLRSPAEPVPPACGAVPDTVLVPLADLSDVGVTDEVAPGLSGRAMLSAVRALGPLSVAWPDERTDPSVRVELDVQTRGPDACLMRSTTPEWTVDDVREPPGYRAGEPVVGLVVPVTMTVGSTDGRVRASLPGYLRAGVTGEAARWQGEVEGFGGMSPVRANSGDVVVDLPLGARELGLLSLSVNVPVQDGGYPARLSFDRWSRFPGLPPYPDVHESASNRASCFGRRLQDFGVRLSEPY